MLRLRDIAKISRCVSSVINCKHAELLQKFPQSANGLYLVKRDKSKSSQGDKGCDSKEKLEPLMDIKCKSVVFTGGVNGIGFATANQLLSEGAAHVFISGVNIEEGECAEQKLQKQFGEDKATYIPGDVRDDAHLAGLFEICMDKFENVDIFINDAAILEDRLAKHTVDINMTGTLRACLLGMRYMGKNECGKGGVIVNLSSIYGLQPLPSAPVHSSTKYGVIGITMNLGDKFHFNTTFVRVVALCPGLTDTPHIKEVGYKQYKEEWGEELEQELSCGDKQPPETVAKGMSYIIKMAPSATVWTVEECTLYLVEIPDRKTYSKLVAEMK